MTADGQRFLFVKNAEEQSGADGNPQIIVVLNWHQELLERVPLP